MFLMVPESKFRVGSRAAGMERSVGRVERPWAQSRNSFRRTPGDTDTCTHWSRPRRRHRSATSGSGMVSISSSIDSILSAAKSCFDILVTGGQGQKSQRGVGFPFLRGGCKFFQSEGSLPPSLMLIIQAIKWETNQYFATGTYFDKFFSQRVL